MHKSKERVDGNGEIFMGTKQIQVVSSGDVLKIFLFTFEEYQRFTECFNRIYSRDDLYQEDAYVFFQTRLLLIRKYEAKNDPVYLKNVLEAFKTNNPEYLADVSALLQKIDEIENNQLEIYLSDGSKRNLRETVEDVLYGMYLHADINRIENLTKTNMSTYMFAVQKYVTFWESLLTETYNLINNRINDKYSREEFEKASIIFTGTDNLQGQDIKSAPYWSNMRGRDAETDEVSTQLDKLSSEEKRILALVQSFFSELKKSNYSKQKLRKMILPVMKTYWGDFKTIHNEIADIDIGFSSKVRFNDSHDIAHVLLFKHFPPEGQIIIDQPQYSEDITAIYLKRGGDKSDWKIVSVNVEPDKLIKSITVDPNRTIQRIFDLITRR